MFRCKVCGWLNAGDVPPDTCPSCGSPADRFRPVATGLARPVGPATGLTPGARLRLLALVPATIDSPFVRHDGPRLDVVTGDSAWFDDNIPCMRACPVNTDIATYIGHVAGGAFGLAAQLNRDQNIFAGTLGRACSRPCEDACRRTVIDSPIQIRALKRVATDHPNAGESALAGGPASDQIAPSGRRIAVIGAGVAGLTSARDLRLAGHDVTVFERDPVPGGLMVSGVPAWRLPRDIAATDIASITALGIMVETGRELGRDLSVARLSARYDAVVVATGAQKVVALPGSPFTSPPGDSTSIAAGLIDGLSFLRHVANGGQRTSGPVVVIGGGYTALDCARTARRLAAGTVTVVMRQAAATSIIDDELADAAAEGVTVMTGSAFAGISRDDGILNGATLRSANGTEQTIPCSLVIVAIGQEPDWSVIDQPAGPMTEDADALTTDLNGRLPRWPNVWLAGDVVDGSSSFIEAIASGKRAAAGIDRSLRLATPEIGTPSALGAERMVPLGLEAMPTAVASSEETGTPEWTRDLLHRRVIDHEPYRETRAQPSRVLDPPDRGLEGGDPAVEVDLGMTAEIGQEEAARCLQCQANIFIDADRCILCNGCVDVCPYGCIEMLGLDRLATIDGTNPDDAARIVPHTVAMLIDEDSCIRCGKCVDWCPTSCLTMSAHGPTVGGQPNGFDIRSLLDGG